MNVPQVRRTHVAMMISLNDLGAGHAEIIPRDPFVVGLIITQKSLLNGRRHPFADSFIPFGTDLALGMSRGSAALGQFGDKACHAAHSG